MRGKRFGLRAMEGSCPVERMMRDFGDVRFLFGGVLADGPGVRAGAGQGSDGVPFFWGLEARGKNELSAYGVWWGFLKGSSCGASRPAGTVR